MFPNRWFSTRFPHSFFNDCFHFLESLVDGKAAVDRPVTFFFQEKNARSKSWEELIAAKPPERSQGDQHPDQAVDEPPCDAPSSRGSLKAAPGAAEEPPDSSDMMAFMLDSPGGAVGVSLSLFSLGLLSVYVSIPKQIVLVDSNLVDNDMARR